MREWERDRSTFRCPHLLENRISLGFEFGNAKIGKGVGVLSFNDIDELKVRFRALILYRRGGGLDFGLKERKK